MYTTKPLSLFRSQPEAISLLPPPEGQNAGGGYLVVKRATGEDDDEQSCCWGTCCPGRMLDLPFPQNRVLKVRFQDGGKDGGRYQESVVFVPVAGQPLASNRYHAVVAKGRRRGLVRACSREEEHTGTGCFCRSISDVEPRPFDPADVYQQIEIVQRRRGWFTARAAAPDGVPSSLYRSKYWQVYEFKQPKKILDLGEALGLDAAAALRARRQLAGAFQFQGATMAGDVGKWYCPFFLVKEHGVAPREQMERGAFYEVALEQRWEPVLGDAKLAGKKVLIRGSVEAKMEGQSSGHGDAYVWFVGATGDRVGVCTTVWEGMLWEETRGGWVDDAEELEAGSVADGSVVLVERFVVRRMDRSVAVAFEFVHRNKVKTEQV
ncbi:unnamed protein product [Urochloa decumbens]|uniref:Uncharacterized protein n=1 Tax=Urochloa decumbens TaxID=240449 RepID=A0ABC9BBN2_9POAL